MQQKHFDVAIVGAGISGAATAKVVAQYTNTKSIALFETAKKAGMLNSNSRNNSQTLHDGSTEHYNFEKASKVKRDTDLTATYIEQRSDERIFRFGPKLLLGVGEEEVITVTKRYTEFSSLYPTMELIRSVEIGKREPFIMKGRNPHEAIVALSNDGYTIDFGLLAQAFVQDAMDTGKVTFFSETRINEREIMQFNGGMYLLTDYSGNKYTADVVVFATGAYSLLAAKTLGLADHLGILPIGGNFYDTTRQLLNGKVYTVQNPKRPFAAIHGDPEKTNQSITRFGPTAIVLPTLVDGDWSTVADFMRVSVPNWDGVTTLAGILADPDMLAYMVHNMAYQLPLIGKYLFMQSARKIVPTIQYSDLVFHKGRGLRPQLVDTSKKKLELGDARVFGNCSIFNVAPSPGASVALANGFRDALKIVEFFEGSISFNQEKWDEDFAHLTQPELVH